MADVIVVGGGPAGSATALTLARDGFDVTLVERARFPRRKVCGEYLNAGAMSALDRLGVGDAVRAAGAPLRGVRIVPPGASALELPFSSPGGACARETLDALLLDAAAAAGVTVVQGRVEDVIVRDGRIEGVGLRGDDGGVTAMSARWVVGADGCGSVVARRSGLTRPSRGIPRFAVGGHYTGFDSLGEFVEMYVGAHAYFALNPIGGGRTNVMVVVPKRDLERWSRDVDDGVAGAAAKLGRGVRSFADAQRVGSRAAVGPLAHDVHTPIADGLVLVGDAAGFLNPFTGQGVYLALASAAAAARAIGRAACDRSAERRAFADYANERASDIAARKRLSAAVGVLLDVAPLARRAVSRLRQTPSLAAVLVDALAGIRPPATALAPAVLGKLVL